MILNAIESSLTVKLDALIMRTLNNMIGETLYDEFPSGTYTNTTGVKAVNLLYLYNQQYSASLTKDVAMVTPEFFRFASYTIANHIDRLKVLSKLYNIGGEARFTPASKLHIVMHSEFKNGADVFLQSDTFHDTYTALPNADTIPFWQGSGTDFGFDSTSAIKIKTSSGHDIDASGILAVMFDRDALGVSNLDREVRTHYNEKADFWNYFYKEFAGYFNDTNENCVVFYVA